MPYSGIFCGVKLLWIRTILVISGKIFVLCIATLTTPHIMHVSFAHDRNFSLKNMADNQFEVEAMVLCYHNECTEVQNPR